MSLNILKLVQISLDVEISHYQRLPIDMLAKRLMSTNLLSIKAIKGSDSG
jgi:hypothetical protein